MVQSLIGCPPTSTSTAVPHGKHTEQPWTSVEAATLGQKPPQDQQTSCGCVHVYYIEKQVASTSCGDGCVPRTTSSLRDGVCDGAYSTGEVGDISLVDISRRNGNLRQHDPCNREIWGWVPTGMSLLHDDDLYNFFLRVSTLSQQLYRKKRLSSPLYRKCAGGRQGRERSILFYRSIAPRPIKTVLLYMYSR